jgi:glycosyltransferase involved in cell wall biosynthesis
MSQCPRWNWGGRSQRVASRMDGVPLLGAWWVSPGNWRTTQILLDGARATDCCVRPWNYMMQRKTAMRTSESPTGSAINSNELPPGLFQTPKVEEVRQVPRILYLAPHTCQSAAHSGVQRVATQVARALLRRTNVEFVKWDLVDEQMRYFNSYDFKLFFQSSSWPAIARVNRFAERIRCRFEETLPQRGGRIDWLFMPEIFYHLPSGLEIYERVIVQAQQLGIRTMAVFHDLIPITNPLYHEPYRRWHEQYVADLLKVDLIIANSLYSAQQLLAYCTEKLKDTSGDLYALHQQIVPLPLATLNDGVVLRRVAEVDRRRDIVVLLGTVEPRKQQIEVIRAFKQLNLAERCGLKVVVVGSLHPSISAEFGRLIKGDSAIAYVGYASEQLVNAIFDRARFSVFASNDEGFGLPICESLARGVPCLAANFGAMQEVGAGGGCVLVDVNDENELRRGLEMLARDDGTISRLEDEIARRKFRSWDDYARDVLQAMERHCVA